MTGNAKQEKITSIRIRPEEPRDYDVVYEINRLAFDSSNEAEIVNNLRHHVGPVISLVAEIKSQIVGHIMFSPVKIVGYINEWEAIGLGPVAVLPKYQRQGIGSSLIYAGLEVCCQLDQYIVFVLGHHDYYPRFGFELASRKGFHYKSTEYDPNFFVLELKHGALLGKFGYVHFLPAFGID